MHQPDSRLRPNLTISHIESPLSDYTYSRIFPFPISTHMHVIVPNFPNLSTLIPSCIVPFD